MSNRRAMLNVLAWIVVATSAGVSARLAATKSPDWIIARWTQEMQTLADGPAAERVALIAQFDSSIDALVALMGDPRSSVFLAVRQRLREQLQTWRGLESDQSASHILALAKTLHQQIPKNATDEAQPTSFWHHDAYQLAAELAEAAADWPVPATFPNRSDITVLCDEIIRNCAAHHRFTAPKDDLEYSSLFQPSDDGPVARRGIKDERPSSNSDSVKLPELAGGGLPVSPQQVPPLPSTLQQSFPEGAGDIEGTTLLEPRTPPVPRQLDFPNAAPTPPSLFQMDQIRPLTPLPGRARDETIGQSAPTPASMESGILLGQVQDATTYDLIRALSSTDSHYVSASRRELRRRGFRDLEFQLAIELNSVKEEDRLKLVRRLTRQSQSDARSWLLWLSRDDSPRVRKTVASVMATSRDNMLRNRIDQMAAEDPSRSVRDHVLKLLEKIE